MDKYKGRVDEAPSIGSSSWVVEREATSRDLDPEVELARWKRHSIYQVPERSKNLHNSKAYQPELGSLGPFHHGDPELLPMEEHKRRAVVHLVKRSGRPLREFVTAVAEVTQQLQEAYKDLGTEWRGDDNRQRFVELMLTDGCFLLEVMRMAIGGRAPFPRTMSMVILSSAGTTSSTSGHLSSATCSWSRTSCPYSCSTGSPLQLKVEKHR